MTVAPADAIRRLAFAGLVAAAALLAGCAALPFGDRKDDAEREAAAPQPSVELYTLTIDAPGALAKLLEDNLDLARFRSAPTTEAIGTAELDRLAAAAPAQARALLETEGYFDATVTVARDVDPGSGLPRVAVKAVPGPRVTVAKVELESTAPIASPSIGRNVGSADRIERLRRSWPLREGLPFRQAAWSEAKTSMLNLLRSDGYPAAEWKETHARIDAGAREATLSLVVDPGPLHRLGEVRVDGLERYDAETVRRLASFSRGDVYSEQKLLDYQDRLLKVGLFEGASVEIDPASTGVAGTPDAVPVIVRVKEQTLQQATFGVGYSANTGGRVSVDYFDRQLFGRQLIQHSKLQYGADLKSFGSELSTYPGRRLWRNLVAGNIEDLKSADETRRSWFARVGRAQDSARFDRLYALEINHARLDNDKFAQNATALWFNASWLRRDLDSVLLPTDGNVLAAQAGAGLGRGRQQVGDDPEERRRDPFLRIWGRGFWYRPIGSWYGNARLELGQVFVPNRIAVPDPLLFRAGGDDSVRGYSYRTLGPKIAGEPSSGRVIGTGTLEMAHTILASLPSVWGAVFVDAGNAADGWGSFKPRLGYGAGVRWRSPVGPVKADLAYGEHTKKFRVHFSVGIAF